MLCRSFCTTLVLALLAVADHTSASTRRHHLNRLETTNQTLSARSNDNAKFTYYEAGLGACGQTNKDSDWIVAMNSDQYDNGSHCYATIEITYNGKSAKAAVMDECPGCPYGGLDLTPSLFSYFADESEGVIYGSWDFS